MPAEPVPCPSCQVPLPEGGAAACPMCRLPLTGAAAARLWEVDQRLATLGLEREQLIAALRERGPQTTPTPAMAPSPRLGETPPGQRRFTGQQALLAVGVLLVLVAALVFLAVAWDRIGALGQVAAMGGLTALTAYAALRLARAGLGSSAEAMAVLTAGLLLLDVAAARSLGLAGLETVDLRSYGALTGAGVAIILAVLHGQDRRIAAFGIGSLVAASGAWAAVMGWATDSAPEFAAMALAGAVLFGAAALALPRSTGLVRSSADGPASLWLVVGLAAALSGALGDDLSETRLTGTAAASIGLLLLTAVSGAVILAWVVRARAALLGGRVAVRRDWLSRPLSGQWRAPGVLGLCVTAAGPAALVAPGWQLGPELAAGTACLAAAGAAALAWVRPLGSGLAGGWAELGAFLALTGTVASAAHWDSEPAGSITLLSLAAAAAVVAVCRPRLRVWAAGLSVLTAAIGSHLAGGLLSDGAQVAALAALGVAAGVVAVVRLGQPEEPALGIGAALVAGAAIMLAAIHDWPYAVAGLCALTGLLAAAYAALPRRRPVVVLGVLGLAGAVWTLLDEAGVETLEAYSLSLAVLALAAGLWAGQSAPLSSWVALGPGAMAGLLPSALAAVGDDGLTRPLLTVVAAAMVLAVGARQRWQALVVTGSAAAALVAVSQAAPYAIGAPRWVTLGLTGAALLALGARYEQRRVDARRAAAWFAGLD